MTPDVETPVLEWARRVDLREPVRWGEIEAQVLARAPMEAEKPTLEYRLMVAAGFSSLLVGVILTVGAPVVGLLVVASGPGLDSGWRDVARIAFLITWATQVGVLRLWWAGHRRRDPELVVTSVVAVLASAASVVVGRARLDESDGLWIYAAIGGLLALPVLLVVVSSPRRRVSVRRPPRRGPRSGALRARYHATRDEVLDILIQRRLVRLDEADRQRVSEMPLGYWEELDDVDDAERRRILELRITGWREFTSDDERLWPRGRRRPPAGGR
ncbi:hypothetical protein [Nocardioides sp.]|uniref:hypothetical protein n=1 Tax=Nocardioides sp. TaxID=35761 RepID=UPI003513569C